MGWGRKLVEHYVDGRKKKATITIYKHEPCIIHWISKDKNFKDYKIELDSITTYDEKSGEDIELQIYDYKFEPIVKTFTPLEDNGDTHEILGVIEVELIFVPSAKHMHLLKVNDFVVDYVLSFIKDEDYAEEDEDYILVSNYRVILDMENTDD